MSDKFEFAAYTTDYASKMTISARRIKDRDGKSSHIANITIRRASLSDNPRENASVVVTNRDVIFALRRLADMIELGTEFTLKKYVDKREKGRPDA